MTKESHICFNQLLLRQGLVRGLLDRLIITHSAALEVLLDRDWIIDDNTWVITREHSIYRFTSTGKYPWNVSFDIDWQCNLHGRRWEAADTVVVNWHPLNTVDVQLASLFNFITELMSSHGPDGVAYKD